MLSQETQNKIAEIAKEANRNSRYKVLIPSSRSLSEYDSTDLLSIIVYCGGITAEYVEARDVLERRFEELKDLKQENKRLRAEAETLLRMINNGLSLEDIKTELQNFGKPTVI